MARNLFPTKRRKAFVAAVAAGEVYSQPAPVREDLRDSYYRDGRRCTHLARECEWIGWIEESDRLVDGRPDTRWWKTTAAGERLINKENNRG